ncbi:S-layer homology domain-containing protein, partial [Candidatus Dojkabacteria bacterium]|nr:S-layer homology domain-containing protein [Candidatus Dojkabacteria bacterium]
LTFTVNSGTGSSVRVDNANYFTDGFGVQDGDMVSIDGLTARVIGVNYETETLTLDRTISWSQGAEVTYPYSGNAPDIGACEYKTVSSPTPTPTLTATPSATPTPTVTPTSEPSITPGPTSTPTVTPTNTATPSPSATSTPSSSGSASSGSSSSGSGSSGGSGSETIPLSAGIVPFTDVANTTFETYIDSLYERGIINGYNDKTFRPDTYVSRGEMSKFIVNAFEIALDTSGENFKDVDQNNIFWVYIQTMKNNAITSGYPNGTYRPNQSVTRGEATKFVVLALQTKGVSVLLDTNSIFLDTENHTFQPYISFLAQYRPGDEYIIQGYGNGDFGPDDPTTRGAMAKIIHSSSAKFAPGNVLGILDANGPSTYTQKSLGTTFVPQLFVLAVVIGTGILSVGYNSYKSHYI